MRLRGCCPCLRGDAVSDEETVSMSAFHIPPRRRSDYQGFDEISDDGSCRSRSASTTSSTYIQPQLYDDTLESSDDYTLFGPPSLEDRVKREDLDSSFGIIHFTTKLCLKKVTVQLCDLRGLPAKGPQRTRAYWTAARVCVRKCAKKCRAVRGNERDTKVQLNEELTFLGSEGDTVQITVFEESDREKPLNRVDIVGHCEVTLERTQLNGTEDQDSGEERGHTVKLTQSLVSTPLGQLLLSLHYEDLSQLTVAVIKTKGLQEASIKIVLRCNGEKVKKGRIKGNGPIYNQSFKFILPEQFVPSSSVLLTLVGRQRKQAGFCIAGPWCTFSDGRLTQWGEMLMLKKAVVQWRYIYPLP
ncbi:synaptotagmin-17-like [Galendromus occidentalis]|uniref:Synaptotagmin-17-like n=1 Tax=Galendromus occidentalis TaxID=34638 RepID=A0AAJ7SF19_9ACAR|nr:synaptotagmin-17-like [Galendromus occidentalis]